MRSSLSTFCHNTPLTSRKVGIECSEQADLEALEDVICLLRLLASASKFLALEEISSSPMEEAHHLVLSQCGVFLF